MDIKRRLGLPLLVLLCSVLGVVLFSHKTFAADSNLNAIIGSSAISCQPAGQPSNIYEQAWTASSSYNFYYATMRMSEGNWATSTMQLRFDIFNASSLHASGSTLATGYLDTSTLTSSYATTTIVFDHSVPITLGQQYALQITYTDTDCTWPTYAPARFEQSTKVGNTKFNIKTSGTWYYDYALTARYIFDMVSHTVTSHGLSITQPQQDDDVGNFTQISFIGTCEDAYAPLTLKVIPEYCFWGGGEQCAADHASEPVDYLIQNISCIGNVWTNSSLQLYGYTGKVQAQVFDSGYASSTPVGFYLVDTSGYNGSPGSYNWYHEGENFSSTTCNGLVNWTCNLPLVGDFCAAGATVVNEGSCYIGATIRNYEGVVTSTYPFAYGFQLYNALYSEMDYTTTSSSTIPVLQLNFGHGTTTLFNMNGDPPASFETVADTLYPWETIIIHFGFFVYLISLIL